MEDAAGPAREIIRLDQGYYILATSALADSRRHILREGHSFGIFDRYGDILPIGIGEQGLFHLGTRFLSRYELRMGEQRPLLLGSMVRKDNSLLSVDMANPDIATEEELTLQRDSVHIVRFRFLRGAVCYERLRFQNFLRHPVTLPFRLHYEADFRDLFEVRGLHRKQRGELLEPEVADGLVRLGYLGLDKVHRVATLRSNTTPDSTTASDMSFTLQLEPKQEADYEFSVGFEVEDDRPATFDFGPALTESRTALEAKEGTGATIVTGSNQFNALLSRCVNDLTMMTTVTPHGLYPFAGVPWYSTVFGRDGLITALEVLWVDPEVARGVLSVLAQLQATELDPDRDAEPGKIIHEMRDGEMANTGEIPFGRYYGSIDSTPLFVMLAGRYFQRTADLDFIAGLWPHIERATVWIEEYGDIDDDGFVEYAKRSEDGLVQQGWKDSHDSVFHADGSDAPAPIALCEVQGYVYAAYLLASEMADALMRHEQAEDFRHSAENLRRKFERAFWLPELGTYALALDGDKRPCAVRSSNAGHCLYSGIVSASRARSVARELLSPHGFSGWGIRTLDAREVRYNPMSYHNGSIWPHDNALVAAGLARYGMPNRARRVLQALTDVALHSEDYRLPELFCGFHRREGEGLTDYPLACAPQAWASASIIQCLQACLGLDIDARAGRVTLFNPTLPSRIRELTINDLEVGRASLDIHLRCSGDDLSVHVTRKRGKVDLLVQR